MLLNNWYVNKTGLVGGYRAVQQPCLYIVNVPQICVARITVILNFVVAGILNIYLHINICFALTFVECLILFLLFLTAHNLFFKVQH